MWRFLVNFYRLMLESESARKTRKQKERAREQEQRAKAEHERSLQVFRDGYRYRVTSRAVLR